MTRNCSKNKIGGFMKKLISIRISDKNDAKLKELSAKEQCSQAEIVARALSILFDRLTKRNGEEK
jgi:predicted transcriptional regulator